MKILLSIIIIFTTTSITAQGKKAEKWTDDIIYKGRPSVELSYGESFLKIKDEIILPDEYGLIELKLGYYSDRNLRKSKIISRLRNTFVYGSVSTTGLKVRENETGHPDIWKFGIGSTEGYGYRTGSKLPVNLYSTSAMKWTYIEDIDMIEEFQTNYIDYYSGHLRFGTKMEAGIAIPIGNHVSLNTKFERALMFPRHLFLKWFGNTILEAGLEGALDGFLNAVLASSPNSLPVLNFLLRNGLAYGFYELRRTNMYWPFNSEKPLLFDSYKIGINVVF